MAKSQARMWREVGEYETKILSIECSPSICKVYIKNKMHLEQIQQITVSKEIGGWIHSTANNITQQDSKIIFFMLVEQLARTTFELYENMWSILGYC